MVHRTLVLTLLAIFLFCVRLSAESALPPKRIAVLPTFSDFEGDSTWRHAIAGFDARLQGELLSRWKVEMLSRAGLSSVVFEGKLRAAKDAESKVLQVLPADVLVLTVFDFRKHEFRVHVSKVGDKMKLGPAKSFPTRTPTEVADKAAAEVARYIATLNRLSPRSPLVAQPVATKEKVRCALLEPVSDSGRHEALPRISPIIRASLEHTLAESSRGLELIERTRSSVLLDERALGSWNANGAASLGGMVGADLTLVPFIQFQDASHIHSILFAMDSRSGRLLASRMWNGAPFDEAPQGEIGSLIDDSLAALRSEHQHLSTDNVEQRHAEAEFYIGLKGSWAGLRQRVATEAQQATRFADAAIALGQDEASYMGRAIANYAGAATPALAFPLRYEFEPHSDHTVELRGLRDSGQLEMLYADAMRVFELPLLEMGKNERDWERATLAGLYIRTGEATKALSLLTAGKGSLRELAKNDLLYQQIAQALMNLGRYQECIDFVLSRPRFSDFAMLLVVDAYRALGNSHREFELLWRNRHAADASEDRLSRLLELSIVEGQARDALGYVQASSSGWMRNAGLLRLAFLRARIAAGQKELAISEAECFLLSSRKERDDACTKSVAAVLTELSAEPVSALPMAREFIKLPSTCSINLIHDESISASHGAEVATLMADFWGCSVKVWPVRIEAKSLASYNAVSQAVEGNDFAKALLRVQIPSNDALGTVLLTQIKLVSKQKSYVGDIYAAHRGGVSVLSDHYFRKFKQADRRPLALIDAVAACPLTAVRSALWKESRKSSDDSLTFSPPPPDVFATNGLLHVSDRDLGISRQTGELLRSMGGLGLLEAAREVNASDRKEELAGDSPDTALIADISRQLALITPTVIPPPSTVAKP